MNKQRPINIYLLSYKYPVTAIISIVHRFSGALVFLLIPFLLWLLSQSLSSPEQFIELQSALMGPITKFVLWITLSALLCHLVAGVRHLLMDLGWGETLPAAKKSSWAALIICAILILLTGIWLW